MHPESGDAVLPAAWAPPEAIAAMEEQLEAERAALLPAPPQYSDYVSAFATGPEDAKDNGPSPWQAAQLTYARAVREVGARIQVRREVRFAELNVEAYRALWFALLAAPRQWLFTDVSEASVFLQAARVTTTLVQWAYGRDGRLVSTLLDTYVEAAGGYAAQWVALQGAIDNWEWDEGAADDDDSKLRYPTVVPTVVSWRRHGPGSGASSGAGSGASSGASFDADANASMWAALAAYAAFLQVGVDADTLADTLQGEQWRAEDALRRKKHRILIKRGILMGPGPMSADDEAEQGPRRRGRAWWWGELLAHTLGAFLTSYATLIRAHLRMLAVLPKEQGLPRAGAGDVFGYGPERRAPRTLEQMWHVYMDSMVLLHFAAPHCVRLLQQGRLAALNGYLGIINARWTGDACMSRAITDLRAHLKAKADTPLARMLEDVAEAARRTQVLLSAAGRIFMQLSSDALNEVLEELALLHVEGLLDPLLAPHTRGPNAIAFPNVDFAMLEGAARLLNHPNFGVDEELPLTLVSAECALLSALRATKRIAFILKHIGALLHNTEGGGLPWSGRAKRFLGGLGICMPVEVTRASTVTVALMALSHRMDEGIPRDRVSIWEQLQGRDKELGKWALAAGSHAGFMAATDALRRWMPASWLEVTEADGMANAERARLEHQWGEEAAIQRVMSEFAALETAGDKGVKGGKGDKDGKHDMLKLEGGTEVHVWKEGSKRSSDCEKMLTHFVAVAVAKESEGFVPSPDDTSVTAQLIRVLGQKNFTDHNIVLNLGNDEEGTPTSYVIEGARIHRLQLQVRLRLQTAGKTRRKH